MLHLRQRVDSGTMRAMQISTEDGAGFRAGLAAPLAEIGEAWQLGGQQARPGEATPPVLLETFEHLYEAMERTEASLRDDDSRPPGKRPSGEDVSELGEYALELFEQAGRWAKHFDLPEVFNALQAFTIHLARWVARHGGQLLTLEPIVDALAQSANRMHDAGELLSLYQAMSEIIAATAGVIKRDLEKSNPGRPWRLLHLNRAIIATRTHQPDIMEAAFAALAEQLPEDAPVFFTQGMEQMELLNYPPHVREVMERYYRQWSVKRSLH